MVDTTDNGFRAAIQSLREVVLPAVDPTHPMAREQIALVIDWLEFQRLRNPQLADRQRAELAANLRIARAVDALGLALAEADLPVTVARGDALLAAPAATYPELLAAREAVEEALSHAVLLAAALPAEDRAAVEQLVIAGSAPVVALQRAWFLPYGLEADPAAIPSLADALVTAAEEPR